MIISLILDPAVMNEEHFEGIHGYRSSVHAVFKGLKKNGVLVVDSQGILQKELAESIKGLPPKYRYQLLEYYTQLLMNKKKRMIQLNAQGSKGGVLGIISRLSDLHAVDAVCVSQGVLDGGASVPANALPIAQYADSEVELLRDRFYSELPPLNQLSMREVRDCFERAVRYCKWLRFYDKQIGKGNNLEGFFRGIDFILTIWKNSHVVPKEKPEVQIITSTCHYLPRECEEPLDVWEEKNRENQSAIKRVQERLIEPLQRKYSDWQIGLRVKNVHPDLFHARYLHGQFLILNLERGFDFIRGRDYEECAVCTRKRSCDSCPVDVSCAASPLTIRSADAEHLAKLWQLPDYPLE